MDAVRGYWQKFKMNLDNKKFIFMLVCIVIAILGLSPWIAYLVV